MENNIKVKKKKVKSFMAGFVSNKWVALNTRAANGRYRNNTKRNDSYKNVYIKFTREEFKDWCYIQESLIRSLKRPSIDRIDSKGHYSLTNIRIIELNENISIAKSTFTLTHGTCCRCKKQKLIDEFAKSRKTSNGRVSICKPCDNLRSKKTKTN